MLAEPSAQSAVGRQEVREVRNLTAEQSRAARALLNWSRVRLGAKSNLSEDTIREFESGRRIPGAGNLTRIRQALEAAGVVFTLGAPSLTNLSEGEAGVIGSNEM
ncbi:transcriptional regulator [Mesorhizobium sp. 131-2-1]|nr:transcriptional regulator [Mesorhizobium sp. 131-2-1]